MQLPEQHELPEDVVAEFDEVCEGLANVFEGEARETDDFEVHVQTDGTSVDLVVLNYSVVTPPYVEQRLNAIQTLLRRYRRRWLVRIWLFKPTENLLDPDRCIWLEIDSRCAAVYWGKKDIEIFASRSELYLHYWGRDFPEAPPQQRDSTVHDAMYREFIRGVLRELLLKTQENSLYEPRSDFNEGYLSALYSTLHLIEAQAETWQLDRNHIGLEGFSSDAWRRDGLKYWKR